MSVTTELRDMLDAHGIEVTVHRPMTKVELARENRELRELLSELYQCSRQCGCDRCGYKDGCAMFDRMAQLGIEVE